MDVKELGGTVQKPKGMKLNELQAFYIFVGRPSENGYVAVCDKDNKWFHVGPDGRPAYSARFAWVGRFSKDKLVFKASVLSFEKEHLFIDVNGNFVGSRIFAYMLPRKHRVSS